MSDREALKALYKATDGNMAGWHVHHGTELGKAKWAAYEAARAMAAQALEAPEMSDEELVAALLRFYASYKQHRIEVTGIQWGEPLGGVSFEGFMNWLGAASGWVNEEPAP